MEKKNVLNNGFAVAKLVSSVGIGFIVSGLVAIATRDIRGLARVFTTVGGVALTWAAIDAADDAIDGFVDDVKVIVENTKEELKEA